MDKVEIRKGGADDVPVILGMLDSAVVWLNARGITDQWGTEPWSARPRAVRRVRATVTDGMPWIAEVDGVPAGSLTLTPYPGPDVAPAGEPELYVRFLVTDARFHGRGVGSALLAHAVGEARRQGVPLLRVDCFAGSGGRLVDYYARNGFTPTETYEVDGWKGQVLAMRV
ncbi:GNAT family N-acetyltransferase [Streptomyces sp. WAC05374]|uniref:GNAT family N-acetyltransferase n=1 Tax=Streptomyces sp. WAC05374 TaxID=2487420 RepID=UPI000F885C7C|nr:GNAT family N-acetyltransferase [Streptomyces sp. WAC05374]RST12690.1 GNAT family N-acetyltransferase [Streptomyces sp. WAC05374]TDF47236.1 GNAT family N-acetyltransferase [Streptomyces sp. WAC05374]TDF57494.1 GNAT family N-acetyltransferase [Streptomyces sp. WAC05374]TDF61599.1 GNAT family N-acetyltransferase [Streptomyces sp. WAC05374]